MDIRVELDLLITRAFHFETEHFLERLQWPTIEVARVDMDGKLGLLGIREVPMEDICP